jgi:hypothetical protein
MVGRQILELMSRSERNPIPSRQRRNASNAKLGVKAIIIPKNTACNVVISAPTH